MKYITFEESNPKSILWCIWNHKYEVMSNFTFDTIFNWLCNCWINMELPIWIKDVAHLFTKLVRLRLITDSIFSVNLDSIIPTKFTGIWANAVQVYAEKLKVCLHWLWTNLSSKPLLNDGYIQKYCTLPLKILPVMGRISMWLLSKWCQNII